MRSSPHVRLALALAALTLVTTMPAVGATGPTGCVNVVYAKYGKGLYIDYNFVETISFVASSDNPAEGATVVVTVIPSLCATATAIGDLALRLAEEPGRAASAMPALP